MYSGLTGNSSFFKKAIAGIFILYGFTFVLQNEGMDSYRYYSWFTEWGELSFNDYVYTLEQILRGDSYKAGRTDPFTPTLNYLLSRISISSGLLFGVYAILMTAVMFSAYRILTTDGKGGGKRLALYSLAFFAAISIVNINGFRFWFASWLFILSILWISYPDKSNKTGYLILMSAGLVHFSYLLFALLVPLMIRLKKFYVIALGFGLLGLIYPLDKIMMQFTEGNEIGVLLFDAKSDNYLNQETIEEFADKRTNVVWFKRIPFLYYGSVLTLVYTVFLTLKKRVYSKSVMSLLQFTCIFFGFVSHVSEIGQLIRLQGVFITLVIACHLLLISEGVRHKLKSVDFIFMISLLVHLSLVFRAGSESFSVYLLGPMPWLTSIYDSFALSELLF